MGKHAEIMAVKFKQAPDVNTAIALLHALCTKKPVYSPRIANKPLALYGAGKLGRMAKEYFQAIGIPVVFVVDASAEQYKDDLFWNDTAIINPQHVSLEHKQNILLAVCVATVPFTTLQSFLHSDGWLDFVPFYDITEAYRDLHPLGNGWFSGPFGAEEIDGVDAVLAKWSDDTSRAHHLQFIAWQYLREEWFFEGAPVTTTDRYFIPQVVSVLHHNEVFVDLGAHHGDTTGRFLELVDTQFAAIWLVEPDLYNMHCLQEKLKSRLVGIESRKIHILSCAVGDLPCNKTFFHGLGYASQLSALGQTNAGVITIDELMVIEPTFIKMHLEGEEYNALKGGINTIRNSRPIIVATLYHNRLGIWQIPDLLMNTLTDYVFYMRQHSWSDTGSVMYAIPKERYIGAT
ncbi:MAG: hypothetical protein A2X82_05895 [Geobacteraceae bacterium GWC2_55_20]|nr:MAG: hypothetical protein A2X82_05895 [Geobacteraceae bacterium GWC2_55_20]OGU22244.1 MAG: hypothetical protein A2X85_00890 [Geobacteraceae bacterium GWF2_54_21]HCE66594.1 hypothetical protein [Geobacter sp.]